MAIPTLDDYLGRYGLGASATGSKSRAAELLDLLNQAKRGSGTYYGNGGGPVAPGTSLGRQTAKNDRLNEEADVLGYDGDGGKSAPGLLETAVDYLGRIGSASEGYISGTLNTIAPDGGKLDKWTTRTGHYDEDTNDNGFERAWKALKGEDKYHATDFDNGLGHHEGESKQAKVARSIAGFGADVLLDPTTYVTFGAGGVASKVGTELVEGAVKNGLVNSAELGARVAARNAPVEGELLDAATTAARAGQTIDGEVLDSALTGASRRGELAGRSPLELTTGRGGRPMPAGPTPAAGPGTGLVRQDPFETLLRAPATRQPTHNLDDLLRADVPAQAPHNLDDLLRADAAKAPASFEDLLPLTPRAALAMQGRATSDALVRSTARPMPRSGADSLVASTARPMPGSVTSDALTVSRARPMPGAAPADAGRAAASEVPRAAADVPRAGAGAGRDAADDIVDADWSEVVKAPLTGFEKSLADFTKKNAAKELDWTDKVARDAASGFALRGGRGTLEGLRTGIARETGLAGQELEDAALKVFNSLSPEMRGSVQLKAFGATLASSKGGGQTAIGKALAPASDLYHTVRNAVRASNIVRKPLDKVSGSLGEEWGAFLKNGIKGTDNGMDYHAWATLRDAERAKVGGAVARDAAIQGMLRAGESAAKESGDESGFRTTLNKFLTDGDARAVDVDPTDKVAHLAQLTARQMRGQSDEMWADLTTMAQRAGMSKADLDNYVADHQARILTKAGTKKKQDEAVLLAGEKLGVNGSYNPLGRQAEHFVDGEGKRLTNAEANERMGAKLFEEDPFKIHAASMNSLNAARASLTTRMALQDAGLLRKVDLVNVTKTQHATAQNFGAALKRTAAKVGGDDDLARALADPARIGKLMEHVGGEDQVKAASAVQDLLDTERMLREKLGAKEWKRLTDDADRTTLANRANLTSSKSVYNAEQKAAADADGLKAAGSSVTLEDNKTLPAMYQGLFGKDAVRGFIDRQIKSQNSEQMNKFMANVYQPYYTLAKAWMTVGRGPAYVSKNLQGGIFQNYTHGVSTADHKWMAKLLLDGHTTERDARKLLTDAMAGRAVTSPHAAAVSDALRAGGGLPTQGAVRQLQEAMMATKLAGKKISGIDALDAWKLWQGVRDDALGAHKGTEGALEHALRDGSSDISAHIDRGGATNLFRQTGVEDLNGFQRAANRGINNPWMDLGSKAASGSEEFVRGAAFLKGLRTTGTADAGKGALAFARGLHFDYADLSNFERRVVKQVIPFYTWSRMNVPLQLRTLAAKPGVATGLGHAHDNAADGFGPDAETRAKMEAAMPEWLREASGFVTGASTDANPLTFALDTPMNDLNRWIKPGTGAPGAAFDQLANGLNPVLKTGVEQVTGTDTFTGAKLSETGTPAPGWMPDALTFTNADGERVTNAKNMKVLTNLLPPLSMAEKIPGIGGTKARERRDSNLASGVFGLPMATLTESQLAGEMAARNDRLMPQLDRRIGAAGLDEQWLRDALQTYTVEEVKRRIAAGQGRLKPQGG